MREAPSVVLANLLLQAGAHVRAYDPVSIEEAKHDLGETITYCESDMEAIQGADALALITEWSEFKVPNWEKVGQAMKTKVVFDGRNLYRREILSGAGFDYYGIGMSEKIAEKA
jgi:UDPglucose 6-dehydrogenase